MSITSFSINKLKSHFLFTFKNLFYDFMWKKVLLQEMVSLRPCLVLKDHLHHLTKYESKGTKISIFKLFSELGKIWKCNLGFQISQFPISFMNWEKLENIRSPRPTFQNQNIEYMDQLEKRIY